MKTTLAFLVFVASCGLLLGSQPSPVPARPAPLLEELVQMTRAGSSAAAVLAYAQAHRLELPPQVSDDDLHWLRDSGVNQRVVAYMSAFDVRATDESAQQDVDSGSRENAIRPRDAYRYGESEDYGARYPERYADNYPDAYSDNSYDAYSGDYGYGYPDYGFGYYPDYGFGYFPYPFFFADQRPFSRSFHRRGHRFHGPHRFDRGHGFRGPRGDAVGRFASRDAWRERGFRGSRAAPMVVRPRGPARSAFGRRGLGPPQRSHGRTISPRGFGSPGPPRGGFSSGFRGAQRSFGGHGGFSRPGFSSGGGRAFGGSPGGRGRR